MRNRGLGNKTGQFVRLNETPTHSNVLAQRPATADAFIRGPRPHWDTSNRTQATRPALKVGFSRSAPTRRPVAVISDLDQTVIPLHNDWSDIPRPYPGVVSLLHALDKRAGEETQNIFYVTARTADQAHGITDWMKEHGLPDGTTEAVGGDSRQDAVNGKISQISSILNANPELDFVLFGDSSHVDCDVYRTINQLFPGRIKSTFINNVKPIEPARVEGMHLIENYAQAASKLRQMGLLDTTAARQVIDDAIDGGLPLTSKARRDLLLA